MNNEVEYLDKRLSKRAARRIIQRAFVLMGREKPIRQHIRESRLITLWIIEDWDLEWTVYIDRGKFDVERRPAKRPDVTLTWPTAEAFFEEVEGSGDGTLHVQMNPATGQQRFFQPLLRGFFENLRHVLANPLDDVGEPLV